MTSPDRRRAIAVLLTVALVSGAAFAWLKAPASRLVPVSVATAFVKHVQAKRFTEAFALTLGSAQAGRNPEELEQIARRQVCDPLQAAGTAPPQSNGNRLRRWLSRAEIEVPELTVEFEGSCLLGVTLRHLPEGQWRVYRFASHAG